MSDNTQEPGSLEFIINTAVLSMNRRLKDQGYNERERAAMWGMTVTEQRVFLTKVWEHLNNDNKETTVEEIKPKPGPPKTDKAIQTST